MQSNLDILCSLTYTTVFIDSVSGQCRPWSRKLHSIIVYDIIESRKPSACMRVCMRVYLHTCARVCATFYILLHLLSHGHHFPVFQLLESWRSHHARVQGFSSLKRFWFCLLIGGSRCFIRSGAWFCRNNWSWFPGDHNCIIVLTAVCAQAIVQESFYTSPVLPLKENCYSFKGDNSVKCLPF